MPYTNAWDEASPLGSAPANTLDTIIQNKMKDIRERLQQIVPGWVDDDVDPKRVVVHSGSEGIRPEEEDAYQGELFLDIDQQSLSLFDGSSWFGITGDAVRGHLLTDDDAGTQLNSAGAVEKTIFLTIQGTTDAGGLITVDLAELDSIADDLVVSDLADRILIPWGTSDPIQLTFNAVSASTFTIKFWDSTGTAIATTFLTCIAIFTILKPVA